MGNILLKTSKVSKAPGSRWWRWSGSRRRHHQRWGSECFQDFDKSDKCCKLSNWVLPLMEDLIQIQVFQVIFCQFLLRPESAWFALAWWRGRQGGGTTVSALTAEQRVKMILWGEDVTEDWRRYGLVLTKRFTTILTSGWSICPAQPVHLNATIAAFMLTNNYREMLCLNSLATVRNFSTQVCVVNSAFLL